MNVNQTLFDCDCRTLLDLRTPEEVTAGAPPKPMTVGYALARCIGLAQAGDAKSMLQTMRLLKAIADAGESPDGKLTLDNADVTFLTGVMEKSPVYKPVVMGQLHAAITGSGG